MTDCPDHTPTSTTSSHEGLSMADIEDWAA
jgi:hypothetical protein